MLGPGLRIIPQSSGFQVKGLGFRVYRVYGLGFRVVKGFRI